MTVGSCFSGIGGFDLGFERAGFDIRWQSKSILGAEPCSRSTGPMSDAMRMSAPCTAKRRMWPTPNALDGERPIETPQQWRMRQAIKKAANPNLGGLHRPLTVAILEDDQPVDPVSNQLTLFAEAFPVSPTPWLADAAALQTSATSGPSAGDLFARFNPDGSCSKMYPDCSPLMRDGSSEAFSGTWPRAGSMRSGCFLRPSWGTPPRDRVWLVATARRDGRGAGPGRRTNVVAEWPREQNLRWCNSSSGRCGPADARQGASGRVRRKPSAGLSLSAGTSVAVAIGSGLEGHAGNGAAGDQPGRIFSGPNGSISASGLQQFAVQWKSEPDVGRVAHGIPNRVHRLRGLGNSIVPQIAEWIARQITAAEGLSQR
jgi:hypothetical protein